MGLVVFWSGAFRWVIAQCKVGKTIVRTVNSFREVTVMVHQSKIGYDTIYKQFKIHRLTVSLTRVKHQDSCQSSQEWTLNQTYPHVRLSDA